MAEDTKRERSFQLTREQINEEARTIEFSAASSEPYERWDGIETLEISEKAIDFKRLKNAAPLLLEHDTRKQIGVIEKSAIVDGKLRVTARFSKSALAEEIWNDVKDGIRRNVSIGYIIHEEDRKKGKNGADEYMAKRWEPLEVSIVPIPADNTVGVGRSVDISRESVKTTDEPNKPEPKAETREAAPAKVEVISEEQKAILRDAETRKQREVEVAEVKAICERAKFSSEETEEFLSVGAKPEDVRKIAIERLASRTNAPGETQSVTLPKRDANRYSLMRALQCVLRGKPVDGLEGEASQEIARKRGVEPEGFFVPAEIYRMRDMAATDFDKGGAFVDTALRTDQFIDLLRNNTVIDQLGIRRLTGLQGNAAIPMQTAAAVAYWEAEAAAVSPSDQGTGSKMLTPKRLSAATVYSKQLLFQASVAVEQFIREDLLKVIALKQDMAALVGSGGNGEPIGIINTPGINASVTFGGAATLADILQFVADLEDDNALRGNLGFAISPGTKQKWSAIARLSNTDSRTLFDTSTNTVEGYKTVTSTQLVAAPVNHRVIFGNWSDFVLAEWDGLDITVDPYTFVRSQQVQLVMHTHCDMLVRHPVSFSVSTDAGNQ